MMQKALIQTVKICKVTGFYVSGCQSVNIGQLRTSLGEDELEMLNSREELRQQQLHSTISSAHLELQVCDSGTR